MPTFEEYFGGTLITLSDAEVSAMLRDFDPEEVCRFHLEKGGVICQAKKRKPGECEHCGWNPRIARRRAYQVRRWLEDMEETKRNAAD